MQRFSVVICTAALAAIGVAAGAQAAPARHAPMTMPGRSAVVHVRAVADDVLLERAEVEADAEAEAADAADAAGDDDAAAPHETEPAEQEAEPEVEHGRHR